MNVKNHTPFIILLLWSVILYAQPPQPLDYFPHQVGDHWEYREAGTMQIVKILTIEKDSSDSSGNIYLKYQQEPYYSIRIDTVHEVYQWDGLFQEDFALDYKLAGQIGERWIVRDNTFLNTITWAEIKDIYQSVVFNIPTTVMQIDYWWVTQPGDSFWVETRYLAAGFGLIKHIVEPYYSIYAGGAIINGISYGVLTGLPNNTPIPDEFSLRQNYPNPFNPSTTIEYQITEPAMVNLRILNTLGQTVAVLVDEQQLSGPYKVNFNTNNLSSGSYYYRLQANAKILTKKMILLR